MPNISSSVGRPERMLRLLAGVRLARVGLHLAYGMATVGVIYPWARRPLRLWLKRRWSRQLLDILGLRLEGDARHWPASGLVVANHISWLDIFVLNAMAPSAFVSKAEVRGWPGIGWLCERTETVFLPRGSRSAARVAGALISQRLAAGWRVAVFPEGTTGNGSSLLPFHGALFQAAVATGSAVQPVALRYRDDRGQRSEAPVYCGDTSLVQSLYRIAATSGLRARVETLPALSAAGQDRRALAAAARGAIGAALGLISEEDDSAASTVELSLAPA